MKWAKNIIAGILILLFIFTYEFLVYKTIKDKYESKIYDTIVDLRKARLGYDIKLSKTDFIYFLAEGENELAIGDSIVKDAYSVEYKIFRFDVNKKRRVYYKSIYFRKNLDFYNFVVK